jgi:hypothetical protein
LVFGKQFERLWRMKRKLLQKRRRMCPFWSELLVTAESFNHNLLLHKLNHKAWLLVVCVDLHAPCLFSIYTIVICYHWFTIIGCKPFCQFS